MPATSPGEFVRRFVAAMESSDMATIAASFAPRRAGVHHERPGGTDLVEGAEALASRFPDFAAMADRFGATVTQLHEIDEHTVLFMVEIRAGKRLHNFAGVFVRLSDAGQMTEYRMVDAVPEESARFWASRPRVP